MEGLTLEQLKALAYDRIALLEKTQSELRAVNAEIQKLEDEKAIPEIKPEVKKELKQESKK